MRAKAVGGEADVGTQEVSAGGADPMEELVLARKTSVVLTYRERLPWIGALSNPRLGPMLVLNESGYLVPLCTAGDLLRGCRSFWHRSQD
jgi:hypothetical protein